MYLKSLRFKNYGPLAKCQINFGFNDAGDPRPMVLVGANGSGKTVCLSVALDAVATIRSQVSKDAPETKDGKLFKPLKQSNRYLGLSGLALCECTFESNSSEVTFSEFLTTEMIGGVYSLPKGFQKPNNFDENRFQRLGMSKSL